MAINDAPFRAGGLSSGLDTNSIIDGLVKIESQPIQLLRHRQDGLRARVSTIGTIISRLGDLKSAAVDLGSNGVLGTSVASSAAVGFSALTGTGATAGDYDITVDRLARAAKARSQAFASPTSKVTGGNLTLTVMGKDYNVKITDGMALSDVALAIRGTGAPVSATVLSNGTSSYLSITNLSSGYPLDKTQDDALKITETSTGSQGQPLGASILQTADNAQITIDGLPYTRQTNVISDALPGVTLTLKARTTATEKLSVQNDADATAKKLQKFVDAYNGVLSVIESQLHVGKDTDRSTVLTGDTMLQSFKRRLQGLMTKTVGASGVRTLADLGLKTSEDGSLSLDTAKLGSAIAKDANAVNDLFAHAGIGIMPLTRKLVDGATNIVDGTLVTEQKTLNETIGRMDDQADTMQRRVDAYQAQLVQQFTAMETVVSGLRATGNFLTQQANSRSSSQ